MELGAAGSAEDVVPKDSGCQNPSEENQLGSEEKKNVTGTLEIMHSKEEMEPECFTKGEDAGALTCHIQADTQMSCSGTLAGTAQKRQHPNASINDRSACEPCPKKASSESLGSGTEEAAAVAASFNVSFRELPVPCVVRRSLSRYSLKLNSSRRRSLPPLHMDVSELSKAISLDLPEKDRMVELLLSSFRYSACKLKSSLEQTEGFNPETFEEKVCLLLEELRLRAKKLELDGTLQKCFEDPKGDLSDPSLNALVTSLKETISRFSAENQAWEDLLQSYQKNAEEISRQLQQCKMNQVPEEPFNYLGTSQASVFQTRPDYQKILDCQGEVFDCVDQVLDEIHQLVKVCQSYMEDVQHYLQKLTAQFASRAFQGLESSPARKLLRLPQTKEPAFQSPEG